VCRDKARQRSNGNIEAAQPLWSLTEHSAATLIIMHRRGLRPVRQASLHRSVTSILYFIALLRGTPHISRIRSNAHTRIAKQRSRAAALGKYNNRGIPSMSAVLLTRCRVACLADIPKVHYTRFPITSPRREVANLLATAGNKSL